MENTHFAEGRNLMRTREEKGDKLLFDETPLRLGTAIRHCRRLRYLFPQQHTDRPWSA